MTSLKPITAMDIPQFLELNNLAVPHVNAHDKASLAGLLPMSIESSSVKLT
jgi:hypothetical protein